MESPLVSSSSRGFMIRTPARSLSPSSLILCTNTIGVQVLLDGNNLKSLNVGWLRDNIGIVGQEPGPRKTSVPQRFVQNILKNSSKYSPKIFQCSLTAASGRTSVMQNQTPLKKKLWQRAKRRMLTTSSRSFQCSWTPTSVREEPSCLGGRSSGLR